MKLNLCFKQNVNLRHLSIAKEPLVSVITVEFYDVFTQFYWDIKLLKLKAFSSI